MPILDLPLELLQEITDKLPPTEHKSLRTVCRTLNLAVAPRFFSTLVLDVHKYRLETSLSHLEAVGRGNTLWSRYARRLVIMQLSTSVDRYRSSRFWSEAGGSGDGGDSEARFQRCLRPALETLDDVEWTLEECPQDSAWAVAIVLNFLASLPSLNNLRLLTDKTSFAMIQRHDPHPFRRIAGLRRLGVVVYDTHETFRGVCHAFSQTVLHSPRLESLQLEARAGGGAGGAPVYRLPELFSDLGQVSHGLRELRLSGFTLKCDHGAVTPPKMHFHALQSVAWLQGGGNEIWSCLRKEGIWLRAVETDTTSEELLGYLASYESGLLQRLVLMYADGGNEQQNERLADMFFEDVLLRHAGAVEKFGAHNAGKIAAMRKLRTLKMSVNTVCVWSEDGDRESAHPGYHVECDVEGENMVHRFLKLIDQLRIVEAAVFPASPESSRHSSFAIYHLHDGARAIDSAIRDFLSKFSADSDIDFSRTRSEISRPESAPRVLGGWSYYAGGAEDGARLYRAGESVGRRFYA
ncbi:hypothetical protein R3P38DRAFT_3508291 [Favolaschia claudopus]|uniref:F-box domain-containing protein n=1 Tax=Favolaschia claudopus TaxID=2862362 RepID=A0AAW0C0V2_9AGAR